MHFWVGAKSQAMYKDRFRNYKAGRIPWDVVGKHLPVFHRMGNIKELIKF